MASSYTIQRLTLEDLTDDVLGHLSDMHVKAFVNDPFTEIMVEYNPQISDLRWRAAIRATALEGELWVLRVTSKGRNGEIASCATWFPPGKFLFGTEKQRALGYNDYLKRISPATMDWLRNEYSPQMTKALKKTFKPQVWQFNNPVCKMRRLKHNLFQDYEYLWWVSSLATNPCHRGRGYATALIQVLIQKVGQKFEPKEFVGLAASPDNLPFYRSLGFQVDGSGEVTSPKGDRLSFDILTKFRFEEYDIA